MVQGQSARPLVGTSAGRRTCAIADCIHPPVVRDLCSKHYQRWRGKEPLELKDKIAREFVNAQAKSGMTSLAIARAADVSPTTITDLSRGVHLPLHGTVARIAAVVDCERLVQLSAQARTAQCAKCGSNFIRGGKNAARNRYCSKPCAHSDYRTNRREYRARFYKLQLNKAQQVIADFCLSCEPVDRICKDGSCPLRPFSPMPLIQLRRSAA